jgi:threonine synthase
MKMRTNCLLCQKPNDSVNYTCRCKSDTWTREYRTLDLDIQIDPQERKEAIQSVWNYRFDHSLGMLQYRALPFREYVPDTLAPVGMTSFYQLKNFDFPEKSDLFIKNEGDNPSGCFKDRETLMCLLHARAKVLNKAVVYSSGNAAASAALIAQKLKLDLVTFVAGDTYDEKIDFIRNHGSDVIVIGDEDTNFEEGFRMFAYLNAEGVFARHGFDNWSVRNPFRVQGDKTTALEILRQLNTNGQLEAPDFAIVPTANGSGLAGLWKGFQELKALGLINKLPRMVAAGIRGANPVAKAARKHQTARPEKCNLSHLDLEDQIIGSTIIAEEGYDSIEATKAVLNSGGTAVDIERAEVKRNMKRFLEKEKKLALEKGILPEPASMVALSAARQLQKKNISKKGEKIVTILTGHGLKAGDILTSLLEGRQDLQNIVNEIIDQRKEEILEDAPERGRKVTVPPEFEAVSHAFSNLKKELV